MATINLKGFKCERCNYEWISTKYNHDPKPNNLPITCARCKSAYWNKPRLLIRRPTQNNNKDTKSSNNKSKKVKTT